MFFIKLTFWLGLVVLLLPTDQQQQARLYTTAVATVERVATFCDRNAKTCTLAAEAWATFVKKAEFGARLVGDLVSTGARERGADMAPQAPSAGGGQVRGTLSPTDMEPAWRGPPARRAGI
jgi:Family of unknown function (DUF5330)